MRRPFTSLFKTATRYLATKSRVFPGDTRVVHHRFLKEKSESATDILTEINAVAEQCRDSIVIVVEPSYLTLKNKFGGLGQPILSEKDYFDHTIINKDAKFIPYPGHILMTYIDEDGQQDTDLCVSWRPDSPTSVVLGGGRTALHPELYGDDTNPAIIVKGRNTDFDYEVEKMSKSISNTSYVEGHLTVIPLACSKMSLESFRRNYAATTANRLYHLCMSIYKTSDIETVADSRARDEIKMLASIAESLEKDQGRDYKRSSGESIIAALACTHHVTQLVCGNAHHFVNEYGPDLTTQEVSAYLSMAILDNPGFLDFARQVGLFNFASDSIKAKGIELDISGPSV